MVSADKYHDVTLLLRGCSSYISGCQIKCLIINFTHARASHKPALIGPVQSTVNPQPARTHTFSRRHGGKLACGEAGCTRGVIGQTMLDQLIAYLASFWHLKNNRGLWRCGGTKGHRREDKELPQLAKQALLFIVW